MKMLFENGAVEKFAGNCSLLYSSFLYCIMVNRMAWGYTAQELSFLLGQDNDFVECLERFKRFDFSPDLYRQLASVFRHASFIRHQYDDAKELPHEMHRWKAGETIFYRMECLKSVFESVVLFQVSEEDSETQVTRYSNSAKRDQKQSQETIIEMLVEGYFDKPIAAHKLHRKAEYIALRRLRPLHFQNELEKLVGRKGHAPIKRTRRRSYGYRYVLHPDVDKIEGFVFAKQKFENRDDC